MPFAIIVRRGRGRTSFLPDCEAYTQFRNYLSETGRMAAMGRNIRIVLSMAIYMTGLVASVYVGGWVMLLKPVRSTILAYTLGTLTLPQIVVTVVKCISSMTVAGLIWCMGYIASNHIYDSRDE